MLDNNAKIADRAGYAVEPAVAKTVRDYAEEICTVLDDPIAAAAAVNGFVSGETEIEGEEHKKPDSLLDMLHLTLNKAKHLREQLWHLQKLMQ